MAGNNLQLADQYAKIYDEEVVKNNWIGPQVLLSLCEDYIEEGEQLLDIGIGTGASALPFYKRGMKITGIDGSKEMIKVCKAKNFTTQLIQHDLEKMPLSINDNIFRVAISCALFHLIYPIKPLFPEITRALKPGGIFAFTFEEANETKGYHLKEPGVWETKKETQVITYKYETKYIQGLLKKNGLKLLNEQKFLAFTQKETGEEFYFRAVLALKI